MNWNIFCKKKKETMLYIIIRYPIYAYGKVQILIKKKKYFEEYFIKLYKNS